MAFGVWVGVCGFGVGGLGGLGLFGSLGIWGFGGLGVWGFGGLGLRGFGFRSWIRAVTFECQKDNTGEAARNQKPKAQSPKLVGRPLFMP